MAIFGVTVSVAAFLVVQAVMAGFGKDIRSKVLGFSSHVVLRLETERPFDPQLVETVRSQGGVETVTHFVEGEAIIRTEEGEFQGVRLRGIDSRLPASGANVQYFFAEGEDWEFLLGSGERLPGVLLGGELAGSLNVVPFLNEEVELLYPFGEVGPTGEMEPHIRKFRVIGRFKSGYFEYDSKFAIVDIDEAKRLLGDSASEQVGILLENPFRAARFAAALPAIPGVAQVRSWEEIHRSLFHVLRLERFGMGLVLTLMILLASFNILSLLMMVVFQRRREIGVLKALGLPAKGVASVFYRAGAWIALWGGALGGVTGILLIWGLSRARIRLPAPYYIERLPVEFSPWILGVALLLALGICLIATWVPAAESKRLTVIEAIRSE
jgi:lipoprotein-releasing system permease protein